jgi:hypothetical protein
MAAELERALALHLELQKRAYGIAKVKPKHHWQLDQAKQLSRDNCVLDGFIIERIHLQVKAIAEKIKNTSRFEASVLAGVLNATVNTRNKFRGCSRLRGTISPWPGLEGASIAPHMTIFGGHLSRGDVVLRADDAGIIVACLQQGDLLLLMVDRLQLRVAVSQHCGRYQPLGGRSCWVAWHVEVALAWYMEAPVVVIVRR